VRNLSRSVGGSESNELWIGGFPGDQGVPPSLFVGNSVRQAAVAGQRCPRAGLPARIDRINGVVKHILVSPGKCVPNVAVELGIVDAPALEPSLVEIGHHEELRPLSAEVSQAEIVDKGAVEA